VSEALVYATWEVGSDQEPPGQLSGAVSGEERLLWSATLSSGRLLQRLGWSSAFCLGLAIFMFSLAPWGETSAEYCASSKGSRCHSVYVLAWPMVALLIWSTGYLFHTAWKIRVAPWAMLYGLTTKRALRIDVRKPDKILSTRLERGQVRIDLVGDVRFSRSRSGFAFPGLEERDARRAVYWANQGRFRADLPTGVGN
jgi:hypothetical protein